MKKLLLACGLAASAVQFAYAANTMPEGDVAAGEAQAATCAACHGQDGNSMVPSFPKLAGLGERYLYEQMVAIRDGVRVVAQMAGQVDNKSDQELADLAAYYDSLARSGGQADPDLVDLGEKVYRAGVAERNVAACTACHGPHGQGNDPAGYPGLAGQHADPAGKRRQPQFDVVVRCRVHPRRLAGAGAPSKSGNEVGGPSPRPADREIRSSDSVQRPCCSCMRWISISCC